jgi:hypothetical protein
MLLPQLPCMWDMGGEVGNELTSLFTCSGFDSWSKRAVLLLQGNDLQHFLYHLRIVTGHTLLSQLPCILDVGSEVGNEVKFLFACFRFRFLEQASIFFWG